MSAIEILNHAFPTISGVVSASKVAASHGASRNGASRPPQVVQASPVRGKKTLPQLQKVPTGELCRRCGGKRVCETHPKPTCRSETRKRKNTTKVHEEGTGENPLGVSSPGP